jgi:transaldolase
MPETTLKAFADHGDVGPALSADTSAADQTLRAARETGIELDALTAELEREGVRSFCDSYHELLDCIADKVEHTAMAS